MPRALVALLLTLVLAAESAAVTFEARVVRVADGDSFTVEDDRAKRFDVRLNGIDAPERRQPFGEQSRQSLQALVGDKIVTVEVDGADSYGRLIARVRIGGTDVGLTQLQRGLAWSYPWADALPAKEKEGYAAAERRARAAAAGLWTQSEPVAPWVFRRDQRARPPADTRAVRTGAVIGNRRSKVYHREDCPGYRAVSEKNRVVFSSAADAEKAGYRLAGNCSR